MAHIQPDDRRVDKTQIVKRPVGQRQIREFRVDQIDLGATEPLVELDILEGLLLLGGQLVGRAVPIGRRLEQIVDRVVDESLPIVLVVEDRGDQSEQCQGGDTDQTESDLQAAGLPPFASPPGRFARAAPSRRSRRTRPRANDA